MHALLLPAHRGHSRVSVTTAWSLVYKYKLTLISLAGSGKLDLFSCLKNQLLNDWEQQTVRGEMSHRD